MVLLGGCFFGLGKYGIDPEGLLELAAPFGLIVANQAAHIKKAYVEEETEEEDHHEGALNSSEESCGEGFAPQLGDRGEENVSAIEHGDGQEVENREVNIE